MTREFLRFFLLATFTITAHAAFAQSVDHPVEVGGQIGFINVRPLPTTATDASGSTIRFNQFDQGDYASIGGRVGFNLTPHVAIEAEANFIPKRNFSEVEHSRKAQFLAGVKAGFREDKFGLYAKARPGVMYFSSLPSHRTCTFASPVNPICVAESQTNFALDLGGVFEYYPSPRTIIRVDAGDTIVRFQEAGPTQISTSTIVTPAHTGHNFQMSIGFAFRF
jgi:hypothetical protein